MSTLAQKEVRMEAISIAQRLLHTGKGDRLGHYDPEDEEFLPPQMHMSFLRMGIVSHEESPEGGYLLTPLGLAVADELNGMMGDAA